MGNIDLVKNKIQSAEKAVKTVVEWRKQPCKIVFTNGCFDLLHLGHIDYLSKAADMGTHLIIGINTDESVSRNKGPKRPVNLLASRSMVLAALQCVALVIPFDTDTPLELIKIIKPDILVKGGDYSIDNIVGADAVRDAGGEVTTIPFVPGFSSSAIEKKIIEAHNSQL